MPVEFDPADIVDIMDCQSACIIQAAVVEHLRGRARAAEAEAAVLRKQSADALCCAADHEREAANFKQLAGSLERSPISIGHAT